MKEFQKREQRFESRFARNSEIAFQVKARVIALMSEWVAKRLEFADDGARRRFVNDILSRNILDLTASYQMFVDVLKSADVLEDPKKIANLLDVYLEQAISEVYKASGIGEQ